MLVLGLIPSAVLYSWDKKHGRVLTLPESEGDAAAGSGAVPVNASKVEPADPYDNPQ